MPTMNDPIAWRITMPKSAGHRPHWLDWGPLYWSPWFYHAMMRGIRAKGERDQMMRLVAHEIGRSSVLDLCCGPGDLYRWIAHDRYIGIDQNPVFVRSMRQSDIPVDLADILAGSWPEAQVVVMIDSLYHFAGDLDALFSRMQDGTRERAIISEPIHNLMTRAHGPLQHGLAWMTRVQGQIHTHRFTEEQLQAVFDRYGFKTQARTPHNLIGVWDRHD